MTLGAIEGGFITPNIMAGVRELYSQKVNSSQDDMNATSLGAAIKYVDPQKRFSLELLGDRTISTDRLPQGWNVSASARYNFRTGGQK